MRIITNAKENYIEYSAKEFNVNLLSKYFLIKLLTYNTVLYKHVEVDSVQNITITCKFQPQLTSSYKVIMIKIIKVYTTEL